MELAQEFGADDSISLASNPIGFIVIKLVEMDEKQLIDNNKNS